MVDDFARVASEFRTPEEFIARLELARAAMTRDEIVRSPKAKPHKEAWQAAVMALGYMTMMRVAVEVRIVPGEDYADFQLRTGGNTFDFQSTMAVVGRMGEKYRGDDRLGPPFKPRPRNLPAFDVAPIAEAARKKAGGDTKGVHLLLFLNHEGSGANYELVTNAVNEALGDSYESAWVITDEWILCVRPSALLPWNHAGWKRLPLVTPPQDNV